MDTSRRVACTLVAAAAIAWFLGAASPCCGAESGGQGAGSAFVTLGDQLGIFFDLGPRVGLEYRSPAGPGVAVAVGIGLVTLFVGPQPIITGEALAILPLFRLGRSGALDLALGVPTAMWGPILGPGIFITAGGAVRLRFQLGSRWSLLVRAGAGYLFNINTEGIQAGYDSQLRTSLGLDLVVGVAFRL
jgi:hypothetical protein